MIASCENYLREESFSIREITEEIKFRIDGKSYQEGKSLPYEKLRYLKVMHYGFDLKLHQGELIVHIKIADKIISIMQELFEHKYKIEKMVLIDEYDADDIRSMEDNNSSAFNYREIAHKSKLSNHSYGIAIDINPLYNPYICKVDGKTLILPEKGADYVDRNKINPYYIKKNDICYQAFHKRGFTWGGDWEDSKDYQHFEFLDL